MTFLSRHYPVPWTKREWAVWRADPGAGSCWAVQLFQEPLRAVEYAGATLWAEFSEPAYQQRLLSRLLRRLLIRSIMAGAVKG